MKSVASILGPLKDPGFESGLIKRCRICWDKPIEELTNQELATLLRQNLAITYLLPEAEKRIEGNYDDESELFEGELIEVVSYLKNHSN